MPNIESWHSLKTRLTLLMLLGMVLISILVVSGVYWLTLRNAEFDAGQQVNELIDAVEYSAAIALYANDQQIADDVVKGILRSSFVSAVSLSGDAGLNFSRDKHPFAAGRPSISRPLYAPFGVNEQVGTLQATLYPPEIQRRAADSAGKMAFGMASLVLLPGLVFWTVLSRLLSNPLIKISNRLSRLQPGGDERLAAVSANRRDELATLVDNINQLLTTVSNSIAKERKLRFHIEALEQQYESIFSHASSGIVLIDSKGRCLIANPAVSGLFPDWDQTVDGVFSLLPAWEHRLFFEPGEFQGLLVQALQSRNPQSQDLRLLRRSGSQQDWVQVLISCHNHSEHDHVAECLFIDISCRKQIEDEARFLSQHDPLTMLLNRRGLEAKLSLNYAARDNDRGCLLLMDLDRFKQINDQWGHQAGDKLLIEVARRMKTIVRGDDLLARLGGDEFLICLREQPTLQAIEHFLRRLITALTRDVDLGDGASDYVGVSIGVAFYPDNSDDLQQLLNKADAALYQVKNHGRNGYCLYQDGLLQPVMIQLRQ